MLSESQKQALVDLARRTITSHVTRSVEPVPSAVEWPEATGVFVTIKRRGELRGCLGTLQCSGGLAVEVARCAQDAASVDPRFPAVSRDELPELQVEVSVLGPLEAIDPGAPGKIVIGRHGLVAELEGRRGLLLPQVAPQWGWTVEQFLRQTCVKAGLPPGAWQNNARIFRFEAEVFGD